MDELRFIRDQYIGLRDGLLDWLPKHLKGKAWYYRPTPVSTNAAWIVPHLVAFEHSTIYAKVRGWTFPHVATPEFVDRYRGGAAGHQMGDGELADLEESLGCIRRAREATVALLDALVGASTTAGAVDRKDVFERYNANFAHDTEHLGQLKYLAGTWSRLPGS